jgi:hypothetical protein
VQREELLQHRALVAGADVRRTREKPSARSLAATAPASVSSRASRLYEAASAFSTSLKAREPTAREFGDRGLLLGGAHVDLRLQRAAREKRQRGRRPRSTPGCRAPS